MKGERRSLLKVAALITALSLVLCVFASCSIKKEEEPEVTRGAVTIIAPIHTEPDYHGEVTTDPAATRSNASTTSASKSGSGTTAATKADVKDITDLGDYSFENSLENEEVGNAAKKSGTSARDIAEFISVMGYDYDPNQGIFYTSLDNWQRQGNFVEHYDTAAHYINMNYKTIRIDFGPSEGYNWRMQLWKGEYGVFGGCEAGIYTQDPKANNKLYTGADNAHMLQWESALYLSEADFKASNVWFYREWQSHWWLTGFKSGVVNPEDIVMYLHVNMRNKQMAELFEEALLNSGYTKGSLSKIPLNLEDRRKVVESELETDSYARVLNDFYIVWEDLGELNYSQATGN